MAGTNDTMVCMHVVTLRMYSYNLQETTSSYVISLHIAKSNNQSSKTETCLLLICKYNQIKSRYNIDYKQC